MNKKQLIVAWMVGILISLSFLFMPYKIYFREAIYKKADFTSYKEGIVNFDSPILIGYKYGIFTKKQMHPIVVSYRLLGRILPILIIGGLLIYTLRDKKK